MISVIVPAYNESAGLVELYTEISDVLGPYTEPFEVVFVDDGSTDDTPRVLRTLVSSEPATVRVVRLRRNLRKTAALMAGLEIASGDLIVTIDADLQDVPAEIPNLLATLGEGYDMVSGWKQSRQDGFIKRKTSKVFNWFVNRISVSDVHDHGCGLKVFRAEALRSLYLYGGLYNFVVPLLEWQGFTATEVPVRHRPRRYGQSKAALRA